MASDEDFAHRLRGAPAHDTWTPAQADRAVMTDLFSKLDPNVERERLFAAELAELLMGPLVEPVPSGELKNTALSLARKFAALASQRFEVGDEMKERMLALELAISLVVALDYPPGDTQEAAADLGVKLASMARHRFFSVKPGKKKDT